MWFMSFSGFSIFLIILMEAGRGITPNCKFGVLWSDGSHQMHNMKDPDQCPKKVWIFLDQYTILWKDLWTIHWVKSKIYPNYNIQIQLSWESWLIPLTIYKIRGSKHQQYSRHLIMWLSLVWQLLSQINNFIRSCLLFCCWQTIRYKSA